MGMHRKKYKNIQEIDDLAIIPAGHFLYGFMETKYL